MKHMLQDLSDIRLWQSSPQPMSHLIWGRISFSQINATMDVTSVVDTGNLLLLVLSQEDSMRVRSRVDGRHSKYVGEVVKQLGNSWTRSNGVRLSSI